MRLFNKLLLSALVLLALVFVPRAYAQQAFTKAALSQYNGKNGQPAYFAFEGKVYDATGQPNWKEGEHYGNLAGTDLTGMLAGAPHGAEVLRSLPVVGTYQDGTAPQATTAAVAATVPAKEWYEAPIRIAGLSILAWSGIILSVLFVLNFATCFSMPWSQLPLPWKGARPGTDPLDVAPEHMKFTTVHKYFAWSTVIMGIIHTVIGLLQVLGYRL